MITLHILTSFSCILCINYCTLWY